VEFGRIRVELAQALKSEFFEKLLDKDSGEDKVDEAMDALYGTGSGKGGDRHLYPGCSVTTTDGFGHFWT
jgi:hypothetical protein